MYWLSMIATVLPPAEASTRLRLRDLWRGELVEAEASAGPAVDAVVVITLRQDGDGWRVAAWAPILPIESAWLQAAEDFLAPPAAQVASPGADSIQAEAIPATAKPDWSTPGPSLADRFDPTLWDDDEDAELQFGVDGTGDDDDDDEGAGAEPDAVAPPPRRQGLPGSKPSSAPSVEVEDKEAAAAAAVDQMFAPEQVRDVSALPADMPRNFRPAVAEFGLRGRLTLYPDKTDLQIDALRAGSQDDGAEASEAPVVGTIDDLLGDEGWLSKTIAKYQQPAAAAA